MKVKYLIIGGTLIGAFALMSFIKAKTAQAKDVFEKILFKVGFPKNFDISTTRLRFYIDFTLQNPTAQDFTARTGNLITAKGPAASVEFAFAIAARFVDSSTIAQVKSGMLFI